MVEGGYGATVGETGPEEPDVLIVPAARIYDLVPVRELPYGPAAPSLHQRPDRWQHPTTCQPSSKNRLHLAGRPQMSTRPDPGRRIWILLTLYSADCRSQETAAFEFVPRSCQGVRRGRCHRRIDGVDCGIARGLVAVVIQCALGAVVRRLLLPPHPPVAGGFRAIGLQPSDRYQYFSTMLLHRRSDGPRDDDFGRAER